jgi:fibronectin-binding autotransporter adhesin
MVSAILTIGIAVSATGRAQTIYYYTGGNSNWDTTTTDWSTSNSGSPMTAFVSASTSIAKVGDVGSAGTLTLKAAITAQELDIDNLSGFAIGGTPTLTLSNGNISSNFITGNTSTSISTTITAPLSGTNINVLATGTAGGSGASGNDTIILSGTNTFSGNLNIGSAATGSAGIMGINRVNVTAAGALPSTATVNFLNTNTSFAVTSGTLAFSNNFVLNSNATSYTPGAFMSYLGATSSNGLTVNGIISGYGDVTYAAGINGGAGLVLLNKVNTYAGATVLANSTNGVVRIGINNGLPSTTALTFGDGSLSSSSKGNTFGALDLNGFKQTVASLATNLAPVSGTVTMAGTANGIANTSSATSTLTISGSATTTYSSTIGVPANVSNLSGANNYIALSLAATNTGIQTLSGASTYSGGTTINGGSLLVANTSGSATGTGSVTVDGTSSLLGGTGTITGIITVGSAGKGGTISAGAGTPTTVTTLTTGALTLASTSTFNAIIAGDKAYGTLSAPSTTTNVSNAAFTITVPAGTVLTSGETLTLITSRVSGHFTDSTFTASGYNFAADYLANGDFGVDITAVPEPATILGGLLMIGAFCWHQRRQLRGLASVMAGARLG